MKRKMDVHFSSATNEWATPQALYDWLNEIFGFTLDPCCTKATAKCRKFYTIKEDGLKQDWQNEVVFMNPPYGREIGHWVKKAYQEASSGRCKVVCLIPARTDTRWWYKYCTQAKAIMFFVGRVKFECNGKPSGISAPFPSCAVVFDFSDTANMTLWPRCTWVKLSEKK